MASSHNKPKLYFFPGSYYSQKILLALAEKQVPYEKQFIDLPGNENYTPWFMSISSNRGQVPVFQHGGTYITDSTAITEYIDSNFDGRALIPTEFKSEINEFTSLIDSIKIPVLTYGSVMNPDLVKDPIFPAFARSLMRGTVVNCHKSEGLKMYKRQSKGNPALEAAYQVKIEEGLLTMETLHRDRVLENLSLALAVFDQVEKKLEDNAKDPSMKDGWLVCRTFTAADVAFAVYIWRLVAVGFGEKILSTRPHVARYLKRLHSEKPNFVSVCVNPDMRGYMVKWALKTAAKYLTVFVGLVALGVGVWYMKNKG